MCNAVVGFWGRSFAHESVLRRRLRRTLGHERHEYREGVSSESSSSVASLGTGYLVWFWVGEKLGDLTIATTIGRGVALGVCWRREIVRLIPRLRRSIRRRGATAGFWGKVGREEDEEVEVEEDGGGVDPRVDQGATQDLGNDGSGSQILG